MGGGRGGGERINFCGTSPESEDSPGVICLVRASCRLSPLKKKNREDLMLHATQVEMCKEYSIIIIQSYEFFWLHFCTYLQTF
jgi:hypothetical protein